MGRKFGILGVWIAALTLLPALAVAQTPRIVQGVVLHIELPEFVIDLGLQAGLAVGMPVKLYRTMKVRHPVTGKDMVDRFPIGTAEAQEVVDKMAILRPNPELAKWMRVGDRVEIVLAETAPVVAAPVKSPAKKPAPDDDAEPVACPACPVCPPPSASGAPAPVAADFAAADETFRLNLGLHPTERMRNWQKYLARFPSSSLREAIEREIESLGEWLHANGMAQRIGRDEEEAKRSAQVVHHAPLPALRQGEPAWLVLDCADWATVTDVRIHVRKYGTATYDLLRPEPSGVLQRRIKLDAKLVAPPGFEYFIEIARGELGVTRLAGSPEYPTATKVTRPLGQRMPDAGEGSTLRLMGEYVDFNRFRGDDLVGIGTADLSYRLGGDWALYAFQMGYGVLGGRGGKVAERDDSTLLFRNGPQAGQTVKKDDTIDSHGAAFKYAYLGTEWAMHPLFHATTRLVIGLDEAGLNSGIEVAGRIGMETGNNLQIGASSLGEIGRAAFVALTAQLIDKVPMTGLLEVTNRPVREDLGIRLVYQAGWRVTDTFELTGRIGYNLRTIVHAGLSVGGGVAVHW